MKTDSKVGAEPLFITLEGIEGSGKTTQMDRLRCHLEAVGRQVLVTREPGGTPIGQQIRKLLLDPANHALVPEAELLLYMADRVQHIRTRIQPALAAGKVVLCDRFFDATIVYQGAARGLAADMIEQLYTLTCGSLRPDLTFLLDLSPEEGLRRAWDQLANGDRTGAESRFEQEKLDFHYKVRAGYLKLAAAHPARYRIIDASAAPEAVGRAMIEHLDRRLLAP
ncbi:MAG: dTMP kinase [Desulfosarcinaceae bacterium]|nr:dTMP kinase [Desulfosarcinaceae bacterium]